MKLISFSLFGMDKRYSIPLIFNAKSVKNFYPDWIIRVYHDDTVDEDVLNVLISLNVQLINVKKDNFFGFNIAPKFWRFLPVFENNIQAIIFRDSDSIFTERETILVNEWINSRYSYHVIRDHQLHIAPILAGMFGIKFNCFQKLAGLLSYNQKLTNKNNYNSDQIFLADYFYPIIKNDVLVHTSFFAFHSEKHVRIKKCENSSSFIGAVFNDENLNENDLILKSDFVIGIPFWLAKLLRYKVRPVLYLSFYKNLIWNKFNFS